MILGDCAKCKTTGLPVKNGHLVTHMSSAKKPCDWGIPEKTYEWNTPPFISNPHLSFFDNMMTMLDMVEEA